MSSTPTSIRVWPRTYTRLLAELHELERVRERRVSMDTFICHMLDEREERRAYYAAINSDVESREDAVRAYGE